MTSGAEGEQGAAGSFVEPAMELARLTGDIALSHYRRNLVVETKSDGSPVTEADRAAETAARDWVRRLFPADGILGEEFGEERPSARRRWIIDPIDGTKSFIHGVPLWGSLVRGRLRAGRRSVLSRGGGADRRGTRGRLLVEWQSLPGVGRRSPRRGNRPHH
jgi:hypothetical protein